MKTRFIVSAFLTLLAVVALGAFALQHQRLKSLRTQQSHIREEASNLVAASQMLQAQNALPPDSPITSEEKLELMRLRNQVSTLRERQRALAGVSNENLRLRSQTMAANNQPHQVSQEVAPPGYITRKEAEYRGADTPEDAIQSVLWALEHRDTNVMLELLVPESAERLKEQWQSQGTDPYFETFASSAGMLIVRRQDMGPDATELEIQTDPNESTTRKTMLRRVEGTWRVER